MHRLVDPVDAPTLLLWLQSVMIDIVVMLFTIIRSYFPSELRWTAVLTVSP